MVFTDVFTDVTSHGRKIPKSDYQTEGAYPIIDQGQEKIAGYSDCQEVFSDVPVIVFGDHTRKIKYIDEPFLLGADGVKVLKPKLSNVNVKYLYYCLCNVKIPNTGYNRHFKFLKQAAIAIPERKKQDNIVEILDELVKIQELRNREVLFLDELVKARFMEQFDGKDYPVTSIKDMTDVVTKGTTPTTLGFEFVDSGVNFVKVENITETGQILGDDLMHITLECHEKLNRSQLSEGDILFSIAGAIGRTAIVPKEILPANTNQALAIIRLKKNAKVLKPYLLAALSSPYVERQYNNQKKGIAQINLTLKNISDLLIPIPDQAKQEQFASFVEQNDKSKAAIQKSIDETQLLYDSLMQKYFG